MSRNCCNGPEGADQQDQDPQQLPKEIARREKLLGKMDQACARLEERAQARAARRTRRI